MSINIIADYHTHTNNAGRNILFYEFIVGKHAKGSIKENAEAAIKKGLKEIAITDHGYKHIFFGMKKKLYKHVRRQIDEINNEYKEKNIDFKILLGAECNVLKLNGDIDIDEEILRYLDILCIGYHNGAIQDRKVKKNYTEAVINSLMRYNVSILNHPFEYVNPDIIKVGEVAAKRNTAFEINRKHGNIPLKYIKQLKNMGIKFTLGSDAHNPELVGFFGEAYNLAIEAGLTNDDIVNANGSAHKNLKVLKNGGV
jgi:putative hydrolase